MNEAQVVTICGCQWGDEGKGKFSGFFSPEFDYVARFNGGSNAGHTLVHDGKVYKFRMLPCGAIHEHVKCIIGNGCVISLEMLYQDIQNLPYPLESIINRLYISNRAHIVLPMHINMDMELERLRSKSGEIIGTTKNGIGPTYSTKVLRTGIRMGDLLDFEYFKKVFNEFVILNNLSDIITQEQINEHLNRYENYLKLFKNCVVNTNLLISNELKKGKRFIVECANGVLLDIDNGTYPFVTSSNTLTPAIFANLGIPLNFPVLNIGIIKAYQTRVGGGPLPTELIGPLGEKLRDQGNEYGSNTTRPRRCGWLDIPTLRHSHNVCGFNYLILTKLDVLSGFDKISICVDYKIRGQLMERGDFPACINDFTVLEPIYEIAEGWSEDITKCKKFEDLPNNAKKYVNRISELLNIPIKWIGVGVDNDSTFHM